MVSLAYPLGTTTEQFMADPSQYEGMGYPQASTLVASIAMVLAVAPLLLLRYGKGLRARSKVTSALCEGS